MNFYFIPAVTPEYLEKLPTIQSELKEILSKLGITVITNVYLDRYYLLFYKEDSLIYKFEVTKEYDEGAFWQMWDIAKRLRDNSNFLKSCLENPLEGDEIVGFIKR